ncbi:hypothetical protein UlMin_004149 [Ulmus minor]
MRGIHNFDAKNLASPNHNVLTVDHTLPKVTLSSLSLLRVFSEAHLRLYRGVRNVTVGLHPLHHGQFRSSMGGIIFFFCSCLIFHFLVIFSWNLGLVYMIISRKLVDFERTFVAIKPAGVQRGQVKIIFRFERKGFKLVAIKIVVPSKNFSQKHYHNLKERSFFNGLCDFLSSGPVIAMVWEVEGVIKYGRKLIGATNPQKSEPRTIRGDLPIVNIIHGSDGLEIEKDEINLWFKPEELVSFTSNTETWICGQN